MDLVLDEDSHVILAVPNSGNDIHVGDIITHVGDIITFQSNSSENEIIHRVVKTGYDFEGWYAVTRGDNNSSEDPEKLRFDEITGIVIAILY